MSKYIDAKKLIAELRQQKHWLELSIQSQGDYGQSCQIVAYENVISIITSLLQEQPEVDLEKELHNWMVEMDGKYALLATDNVDRLITDTAKHFYELGLNSKKE
jgi:hypothetical protein